MVIKIVIGSDSTLLHKAERPSNYFFLSFTYNQVEQIKKGVICVQILLKGWAASFIQLSWSQ